MHSNASVYLLEKIKLAVLKCDFIGLMFRMQLNVRDIVKPELKTITMS